MGISTGLAECKGLILSKYSSMNICNSVALSAHPIDQCCSLFLVV